MDCLVMLLLSAVDYYVTSVVMLTILPMSVRSVCHGILALNYVLPK
jgi:hypothetical protein